MRHTVQAVMAIGDGGNDLPLLKSAGLGIAMGNAVPEVSMLDAWVIALFCKPDVAPLADRYASIVYQVCSYNSCIELQSFLGNKCNVVICLQVLAAADAVVANNNNDGIAEAIERFIL